MPIRLVDLSAVFREEPWRFIYSGQPLPWPGAKKNRAGFTLPG